MSAIVEHKMLAPESSPAAWRWSCAEYEQMAKFGWFRRQRVELIEGEILVTSPQRAPHSMALLLMAQALQKAFGEAFTVRQQLPLQLSANSQPEPEVAVVRGSARDYREHPTTAELVVEISDTTLAFDRHTKASLYAAAGIQEHWIVNLVDRQVEVHRQPAPDATQPSGAAYLGRHVRGGNETIIPLVAPQGRVPIADVLP